MWHTALITATEYDNFFKLRTNEAADWKIKKIADLMYEAYHAFDNNIHENARLALTGTIDNARWLAVKPQKLKVNEWHCPLIFVEDEESIEQFLTMEEVRSEWKITQELRIEIKKKISVARCARVSYLTHDGKRDIVKDLELFERLRTSGHFSPFEHVATPYFNETIFPNSGDLYNILKSAQAIDDHGNLRSANFYGWKQMRRDLPNENCINFKKG